MDQARNHPSKNSSMKFPFMKWSESIHPKEEDGVATPTIKNHSVTYHKGHLYCFGGYDGRRNHHKLMLYSIREKRWLMGEDTGGTEFRVVGNPPPGRNGHTATLARRARGEDDGVRDVLGGGEELADRLDGMIVSDDAVQSDVTESMEDESAPESRLTENNSTQNSSNENRNIDAQIIIIGGWLGSGPLAASDTWILDISSGLSNLRWFQPPLRGTPPGPCNMHSADYISPKSEVYVYRGGNGREYLNDLHALNVSTYVWRRVETRGTPPQQRANHSSAVLEYNGKCELFIFGGWNGRERLNDIFILDTETSVWSEPRVGGVKPNPRAGMTLTALKGRLYLFGGSGTSSKCFDDLQILDRKDMTWLDVNEDFGGSNNGGSDRGAISNGNFTESDSLDWFYGGDGSNSSGCQDGLGRENEAFNSQGSNMKFADWRLQETEYHYDQQLTSGDNASANPNDDDMLRSVYLTGIPPGKRAGHTATAVGKFIYVFGGSCGTDYLSDFFFLDTDPPPVVKITEPASPQLYARHLAHFSNNEEFADVIFIVEGKQVYAHKLVLSTVSDCFRAMFLAGFRESGSGCSEIEIPDTDYGIFLDMMEYIYTGRAPKINVSASYLEIERAIALLELADQFFLCHLKQICQGILQQAVNADTYLSLLNVAQKTNSGQLEMYCRHFERNMNELLE